DTVASGLYVGNGAGSHGRYQLSNTASLTVDGFTSVGNLGVGTFNHLGGTHVVDNGLLVGVFPGGIGTYNLSGTSTLSVRLSESIGISGGSTGNFTQSAGINNIG